jgi:PAS domain S-box-containing protein
MRDPGSPSDQPRGQGPADAQFLGLILARIPTAIAVVDAEYRVTRVNPAFESMFGFDAAEVLGRALPSLIVPPGVVPILVSHRDQVLAGARIVDESERIRKDGRRLYVRVTAARIEADAVGVLLTFEDVSDRRARERRAAVQSATVHAVSESDTPEAMVEDVLSAMTDHCGWDAVSFWQADTRGRTYRLRHHPRPDVDLDAVTALTEAERAFARRAWITRAPLWLNDGTVDERLSDRVEAPHGAAIAAMPVEAANTTAGVLTVVSLRPRPLESDMLETMYAVGVQLGTGLQRLAAESALAEAESRYRELVQSASDVVWRIDVSGAFVFVNAASQRVFGIAPDQLTGTLLADLSAPDHREEDQRTITRLLRGEEISSHESLQRRAPDDWVHTSTSARPIHDAAGRVTGALGITRDMNDEIATRQALLRAATAAEEAAAARSAFLANMSHEIRTPMSGILGLADLVLEGELTPEQRRSVELIAASGESLLRIINDILDLSKIEVGELRIVTAPFDVLRLADSVVALYRPQGRQRGLDVRSEVADGVPRLLLGDETRIRQVLNNLVSNAVKFTDAGSVDLVVSRAEPGTIRFTVRDTGIGIPGAALETIFEPFRQADVSTTRTYGGTGLGLSICRHLVRLMHGTLTVNSTPDRGTTFEVLLPLPAAPRRSDPLGVSTISPAKGARAATTITTTPLRVLVAEDNPVNQEVTAMMLRRRGHEVDIVANGREAVTAAIRTAYDAILMDLQMPQMDGIDAAQAIRALEGGHRPRILALTADAMAAERDRCLAVGMDGYLTKPIRPAELMAALEQWEAGIDPDMESDSPRGDAVDVERLRSELREGGAEDALPVVLKIFADDASGRVAAITSAFQAGDFNALARAAHAFKSSAGTVRATRLSELLERLEATAKDRSDPDDAYRAVLAESQRVIRQLSGSDPLP